MREEFRRAAFVDGDMRERVAQNRAMGRAQRGERKRIGGRSRRHGIDGDIVLEQRPCALRSSAVIASAP
jgi:hypothetical protein